MNAKPILVLLALSTTPLAIALPPGCKNVPPPNTVNDSGVSLVEAGIGIVDNSCSFLEGIDDSGTLRNVCAFIEEIIAVIPFIEMLRKTVDAGASKIAVKCEPLPRTAFCATSVERAKAVLFIVDMRKARLTIDGGK